MSSPKIPRRALRAAVLAGGLCALLAQAAEPPKVAPKAKPRPLIMERSELRASMASKDRMQQQRDAIDRLQNELQAEKGELQKSGDELKEQLAALDRSNVEAVQKHVDTNNAREKRIDAYEARAAEYNAKVDTLKSEKDRYAQDCENRRFDEKDEIAIKKGK